MYKPLTTKTHFKNDLRFLLCSHMVIERTTRCATATPWMGSIISWAPRRRLQPAWVTQFPAAVVASPAPNRRPSCPWGEWLLLINVLEVRRCGNNRCNNPLPTAITINCRRIIRSTLWAASWASADYTAFQISSTATCWRSSRCRCATWRWAWWWVLRCLSSWRYCSYYHTAKVIWREIGYLYPYYIGNTCIYP